MNKTLADMIDRVREWPEERQADAAKLLEAMEQAGRGPYVLSDAERAVVEAAIAEADRGEFVPDDAMQAFWRRNGG